MSLQTHRSIGDKIHLTTQHFNNWAPGFMGALNGVSMQALTAVTMESPLLVNLLDSHRAQFAKVDTFPFQKYESLKGTLLSVRAPACWSAALLVILAWSCDADALQENETATGAVSDCVSQPVGFDGTEPLLYATVDSEGDKLSLHREYPAIKGLVTQIREPAQANAPTGRSAYIVPGDVVAVGKRCGEWAYVQYIGDREVTTAWVAAGRLSYRPQLRAQGTDAKDGPPAAAYTDDPLKYNFKLTNGKNEPVCVAYLQRLNSSQYSQPPYCGRPETDAVPGFALLKRSSLAFEEISYLSSRVSEFRYGQRQGALEEFNNWRLAHALPQVPPPVTVLNAEDAVGGYLEVWRYDPPVDIDNDAVPDNIIVWQGPPLSGVGVRCGNLWTSNSTNEEYLVRQVQQPLVLIVDGKQIDERRTRQIFAAPGLAGRPAGASAAEDLASLGYNFAIFKYKDRYYFDVFRHDPAGTTARRPPDSNILSVFLRTQGETRRVCEYKMIGRKERQIGAAH